jgi:hypothetical protein
MAGDYIEALQSREPWLRGPLEGVHPLLAPTLHSFTQAREDLAHWTEGLTDAEIWSRPQDLAPVGFHLRHIAGSVNRLTAYIRGEQLTPEQLEAISHEMDPGPARSNSLHELLAEVNEALHNSEQVIRALAPSILGEPRTVGRKKLPTTVIGLVVHLAEHTQRHVGELIVTVKLSHRVVTGRTSPKPS